LGRSLEYFRIPRDILVLCQGKSTYARTGVIVNVTPLEPEWEGYITLSLVNTTPFPAQIYPCEGIAQLVFLRAETECKISYADRKGKYQAQKQIKLSSV
jgi:dCTP deaminase